MAEKIKREKVGQKHKKAIEALDDNNNIVYRFDSCREAGKAFNLTNGAINHCVRGRIKKSAGFRWRLQCSNKET
jgi:hypothetical protein